MKHNKYLLISFLAIITLFAFSLAVSILLVRNRLDLSQNNQNSFLPLVYGQIISQNFTSQHNNLNMIIINAKNPNLINKDEYQFSLKTNTGEIIYQQVVSGFNIGDPGQVRFQFNPIVDSAGKTYSLQIIPLSPESSGGISLAINDKPVDNFNNLTLNDVSSNFVLNFSSYFRSSDKINTAITVIKDIFSNLGRDIVFIFFWLTFIFILIILYFKTTK
jgi:hypothetical protein